MNKKYSGSCLCGQVKFEMVGEFESFFLCHCKFCQKDTGSAHGANLFSAGGHLNWISGVAKVQTFILPSTRHTKSFCQECGSALPNLQMDGKLVVVPAGSLDTEVTIKPNAHIFCASRANWDEGLESVKKFETFPS
ncbi:aldehyde-activating protein [Bdellovibrio bacteriovorus]|uniref:Aldehyde-activating protein n=1 Tax=Bdellovibrio bacteriovorus TaxID=959 RepID=A0A150WK82_BDEBC|nr:GFA family protein [Bdellovibrio bacteriovorus]KYG64100.1 aldehyde-activating protein [Bdellovibrio bacteriovorus]